MERRRSARLAGNHTTKKDAPSVSGGVEDSPPTARMEKVDLPLAPNVKLGPTKTTPPDAQSRPPDAESSLLDTEPTAPDTESTTCDAQSIPAPDTQSSSPLGEGAFIPPSPVHACSCEPKSLANLPTSEAKLDPKLLDLNKKSRNLSPRTKNITPKLSSFNSKPDSSTEALKLSLKPLSSFLDTSVSIKEKSKTDKIDIEPGTRSSSAVEFETVFVDIRDYVESGVQITTAIKRPPSSEPLVQAPPEKRAKFSLEHIPCLFCTEKECSALAVRAHMTKHHHYCKICLVNYKTRNLLAVHWKNHLQTACGICMEPFPIRQLVYHHYNRHPGRPVSVVNIDPKLPEFDHKAAALDLQCVYCLEKPEVQMNLHNWVKHQVITCEKCKLKFRSKNSTKVCAECVLGTRVTPVSPRKSACEAVSTLKEDTNIKNKPDNILPKPAEESCTEESFDVPRILSIHSVRDQITEDYTPEEKTDSLEGGEKGDAVKCASQPRMRAITPRCTNATIAPTTQLFIILGPVQKNAPPEVTPIQCDKTSYRSIVNQGGESSGTSGNVAVEPMRPSAVLQVYKPKPKNPESLKVQSPKHIKAGCSQNGREEQGNSASKKGSDKFNIYCNLCFMYLPNYLLMTSHLDKNHSACLKICLCENKFNAFERFEQHVQTVHKPENSKKFVLNQIMEMGMVFRSPEFSAVRCALCGYSFQTMAWLKIHVSGKHRLYCRACSLSFDTVEQFVAHKKDHEREKISRLECQICLARFMSIRDIEDHSLTTHNGFVKYKEVAVLLVEEETSKDCPFCPERFEEGEKLDEHVKGHPVDIPF